MVDALAKGRFFLVGRNENVKSLVSLKNLCAAVVHLLPRMKPGVEVYNLVDARSYSVRDLASIMARDLGVKWNGRSEDGGQRTVDGGRRAEDGGRRTVGRGRRTEDGGRWTEDGGRRTVFGLRSSVFGLPSSVLGLRSSVFLAHCRCRWPKGSPGLGMLFRASPEKTFL
jgi:nucleoside-diphosphate-sugar epimerase